MELNNETALITGGTSGIGKKIAELLLSKGSKVAICSRSETRVRNTIEELQKKYGSQNIIGQPCDVTDINSLQQFVQEIIEKFGTLRILIANAGISLKYGPVAAYSPQMAQNDAQTIIGVNLLGVINTVSVVVQHMKSQGYGRIITLSGGGADRPIANLSFYAASKGGVVTFSKCLAEEFKERNDNLKINIYHPGMLRTHLTTDIDVVPNWKTKATVVNQTNMALKYMGGNINKSVSSILPYITPSCKKNGKVFRGFSLFKLILGAMKLQKQLKNDSNT